MKRLARLFVAAILCLFSSQASAAFRDAVVTRVTASTSIVANVPTTSTGDYVCAIVTHDIISATTPPAGWTERTTGADLSAPDGQTIRFFDLDGGAPGSPPSTYTWTQVDARDSSVIIASFSGRSLVRTFATVTTNTSANTSPISASFTGGTAAAGDDLLIIAALDERTQADTWSYGLPTGSPGTFVSRINDEFSWSAVLLATIDNIGAGATGSIATTISLTSGSDVAGYGGFVVSLASSGATTNPKWSGWW